MPQVNKIEFNVTPDNMQFLESVKKTSGMSFSEYLNSAVCAIKDLPSDERTYLSRIYEKESKSEAEHSRDMDRQTFRYGNAAMYRSLAFSGFSNMLKIANESGYKSMADTVIES